MTIVQVVVVTLVCIFMLSFGFGAVHWARATLAEYRITFFGNAASRTLNDLTVAIVSNGPTMVVAAVLMWLIGWVLMIVSVVAEAAVLLTALFLWVCPSSKWLQLWWDGACFRVLARQW